MLVTTLISVKHKAGQLLFTIGQFVDEMKCETFFNPFLSFISKVPTFKFRSPESTRKMRPHFKELFLRTLLRNATLRPEQRDIPICLLLGSASLSDLQSRFRFRKKKAA